MQSAQPKWAAGTEDSLIKVSSGRSSHYLKEASLEKLLICSWSVNYVRYGLLVLPEQKQENEFPAFVF